MTPDANRRGVSRISKNVVCSSTIRGNLKKFGTTREATSLIFLTSSLRITCPPLACSVASSDLSVFKNFSKLIFSQLISAGMSRGRISHSIKGHVIFDETELRAII